MENGQNAIVLAWGELYRTQRFGPNTVNRGAVLFECEWDGGRFESGAFVAGFFRSGEFAGGTFFGGFFCHGIWLGGTWEGGFDRHGRYWPRGENPAQGAACSTS
jgi:hypothetical protein